MTQNYQDQLREVKKKYLLGLPEKSEKITSQWLKLININWQVDWLIELQQKAHQLSGTAGAFGFDEMGECAKEIDLLLFAAIHESSTNEIDRQKVSLLIEQLQAHIIHATRHNLNEDMVDKINLGAKQVEKKLIYTVDDDDALCEMIALHLRAEGYEVNVFHSPQDCVEALKQQQPALIIMDIAFPMGGLAGVEAASYIQSEWGKKVPVLFMSVRSDMVARLRALRAGGSAYLTKPLNIEELKSAVANAIDVSLAYKPKVMIVDDDAIYAAQMALQLDGAGFNTNINSKPLQCLQEINKNKPDIIIIDMYMPTISGMELLQVIRQSSDTANLPVIFLTADEDPVLRQKALSNGADIVLNKTIDVKILEKAINETLKNAYRKNPFLNQFNFNDDTAALVEENAEDILSVSSLSVPAADNVSNTTSNTSPQQAENKDALHAATEMFFGEKLPVENLQLCYQVIKTVEGKSSGIYDSFFYFKGPQGEKISANKLLPEIENKRQFLALDKWLLKQTMRDLLNDSETQFVTNICLHVSNVSLLKPNIADLISEFLQQFDELQRGKLIFVIEENWLMRYPQQGIKFCQAMNELNCLMLLNNCGNHSDSILWLDKGLFRFAKLPRSLTKVIKSDSVKQTELKYILNTAMARNCEIIASQVDDQQTLSFFWQLGVRLFA